MNKNERSNHAEQPRKRCVDDGSRKEFDQVLEECELVTHRHRHGDCPRGSGGGVSYDNGAKSNTQGRACPGPWPTGKVGRPGISQLEVRTRGKKRGHHRIFI